ncbi:probable membrane-associated kinase regulator 1 [Nicotiana tomentosiformis]|uniref:probable membrane-associated kinase regulator 1 n=1 Tax=Nicotiana tomentosiformis TaxID=4098 RepID=UPI00051B5D4D|nr:probable membrane-associated kinase regulator 1 [Nicotiana tomentosiformis]
MGRRTDRNPKSYTLPSSPTHSSSSSDFEFTIALSPRSRKSSTNQCPADELFYKGQLLPLHQSPRLSMVRTLLLASSSTSSSSDTTTTASRDSTGSSSSNDSQYSYSSGDLVLLPEGCDSSRPSSVTEEDEFKRLNNSIGIPCTSIKKGNKYLHFSLSRFSSVFRKESKNQKCDSDVISGPLPAQTTTSSSSVRRMSTSAREVIRKYLKKVKPLYEKLSQKPSEKMMVSSNTVTLCMKSQDGFLKSRENGYSSIQSSIKENIQNATISQSFSGNLRYPRRRSYVSSCPSSMRSSPSHSGVLSRSGFTTPTNKTTTGGIYSSDSSTMEELQNAIQGAIAHCKNSMLQNPNTSS